MYRCSKFFGRGLKLKLKTENSDFGACNVCNVLFIIFSVAKMRRVRIIQFV